MSDYCLSRNSRLLQASEFKRVFSRSKRSADAFFTVLAMDSAEKPARLGLAVSKKQASRAVDRNRLKRLIRESFRHHREALAGLDVVVMARKSALGADNSRLFRSLDNHWRELIPASRRLNRS